METIYIVIRGEVNSYDGDTTCVVSCHKTKAGADAAIEVLRSNRKRNKYFTTFYYETAVLED
jgi:hypothetical protein